MKEDEIVEHDIKFKALVEHSVVGIYIIRDGKFTYVNKRFAEIFGYSREEIIGMKNTELTYPEDRNIAEKNVKKRLEGKKESIEYSFRGLTKDGNVIHLHVYGSVYEEDGDRAIIGTLIDETEMVYARAKLEQLANYDSLTGLFNRRVFKQEYDRIIELAKIHNHRVGLILFDIDNFKRINDSLGHDAGDVILYKISKRIKNILRPSELFARIGGDEFAIVVEDFKDLSEVVFLIKKIQENMEENVTYENLNLRVSISLGIALYPEHGDESDNILKAADMALIESKKIGKNRYAFYNKNSKELVSNLELEAEISFALKSRDLEMYLQPQIDIKSGEIRGAEALIRWNHPVRGILYPSDFLSLAGESGQLYKIDIYMIENALSKLSSWRRFRNGNFRVSVNISNALFHHQGFLTQMRILYRKYGNFFESLELELTEEILLEDIGYANGIIEDLHKMGLKLSIDDFGTGYSSLSHLKKLNVNSLKIDRSFIKDIVDDMQDRIIVEAITVMGHALGLKVVAEGVENMEQLEILKNLDCDTVQGYYYSKALKVKDFEQIWLKHSGV